MATVNLGFYRVVAGVVAALLSARGYDVVVEEASHDVLYPRLGKGEFDLFTAAWLPNAHGPLWSANSANLELVSALYDGARFQFAVGPSLSQTIQSIEDLRHSNGAVVRSIQALTPAAGLTRLTRNAVERYGLDVAGMSVVTGAPADWRASIDRALSGAPEVVATWTPLFTDQLPLRPLADPLKALGGEDVAYLVAHRRAFATIDMPTMEMLRKLRVPRRNVATMDLAVSLQGADATTVGREWLQKRLIGRSEDRSTRGPPRNTTIRGRDG